MALERQLAAAACGGCGIGIDPLREATRIVASRIVSICRRCAGSTGDSTTTHVATAAACADCGDPVSPASARVGVIDGAIVLRCIPCASGERPIVAAIELDSLAPAPTRWSLGRARALCAAGAGGTLFVLLGVAIPGPIDPEPASHENIAAVSPTIAGFERAALPHVDAVTPRPTPPASAAVVAPAVPPRRLEVEVEMAVVPPSGGEAVDDSELFEWVHPVAGSEERGPFSHSREFGAERAGIRPPECGAGHCGVDLDGPRGTPIVAVDSGVISALQRGDGDRGGKWVRVRHDSGVVTAYMHLDDIPEYIEVGVAVQRGEWIGVLGTTGIKASKPHLHFSLEMPDGGEMHYLDPGPSLTVAQVVDVLDMIVPE